jgi:hypothetical protein
VSKFTLLLSILVLAALFSLGVGGVSAYHVATSGLEAAQASHRYMEIVLRVTAFWVVIVGVTFPIVAM